MRRAIRSEWVNHLGNSEFHPASELPPFIRSSPSSAYKGVWIWLDCETSSLEIRDPRFKILEYTAVITDLDFNPVDTLSLVVRVDPSDVVYFSRWVRKKFADRSRGGNGLIQECCASSVSASEAGQRLRDFILLHASRRPDGSVLPVMLAGASVHFDRAAVLAAWPHLRSLISHRVIDTSSFLEVVRSFRPDMIRHTPPVAGLHRSAIDVQESISLMKWCVYVFFTRGLV